VAKKLTTKKEIKTKTISVAKYKKLQMNNTDPIKKTRASTRLCPYIATAELFKVMSFIFAN